MNPCMHACVHTYTGGRVDGWVSDDCDVYGGLNHLTHRGWDGMGWAWPHSPVYWPFGFWGVGKSVPFFDRTHQPFNGANLNVESTSGIESTSLMVRPVRFPEVKEGWWIRYDDVVSLASPPKLFQSRINWDVKIPSKSKTKKIKNDSNLSEREENFRWRRLIFFSQTLRANHY